MLFLCWNLQHWKRRKKGQFCSAIIWVPVNIFICSAPYCGGADFLLGEFRRKRCEPLRPLFSHRSLLFCLPSRCYREALYKPVQVFISLIQTVFAHAKHNLELSFTLIVFLEPSCICNYKQFYSVIRSSLSAVCWASGEKTPTDNLFAGISCLKRGFLMLRRWPGKQSPSRNK